MEMNLQDQYDMIRSYFKTTTEPYDDLDWDGESLIVLLNGEVIEEYSYEQLKEYIDGFE